MNVIHYNGKEIRFIEKTETWVCDNLENKSLKALKARIDAISGYKPNVELLLKNYHDGLELVTVTSISPSLTEIWITDNNGRRKVWSPHLYEPTEKNLKILDEVEVLNLVIQSAETEIGELLVELEKPVTLEQLIEQGQNESAKKNRNSNK